MRGRFREKTTPRRYWRSIKGDWRADRVGTETASRRRWESRQSRDGNGFALMIGWGGMDWMGEGRKGKCK